MLLSLQSSSQRSRGVEEGSINLSKDISALRQLRPNKNITMTEENIFLFVPNLIGECKSIVSGIDYKLSEAALRDQRSELHLTAAFILLSI